MLLFGFITFFSFCGNRNDFKYKAKDLLSSEKVQINLGFQYFGDTLFLTDPTKSIKGSFEFRLKDRLVYYDVNDDYKFDISAKKTFKDSSRLLLTIENRSDTLVGYFFNTITNDAAKVICFGDSVLFESGGSF